MAGADRGSGEPGEAPPSPWLPAEPPRLRSGPEHGGAARGRHYRLSRAVASLCLCRGTRGAHPRTPHTQRCLALRFPRAARTRRCLASPSGRCREAFSTRHLGLSQVLTAQGREGETPGPGGGPGDREAARKPGRGRGRRAGPGRSSARILPAGLGADTAGPCPVLQRAGPRRVLRAPCPHTASASERLGIRTDSTPAHSGSCSSAGDRPGSGSVAVGGGSGEANRERQRGSGFSHPPQPAGPERGFPTLRAARGRVPRLRWGRERARPGSGGEPLISAPGRFRSSDYLRDLASERRSMQRLLPLFGYRDGRGGGRGNGDVER